MKKKNHIDRIFLGSVITLILFGFIIFLSSSMGLLAREGASFGAIAVNQLFFGLILGIIAMIITAKIPYTFWRAYSLYIFLFTLLLTALVFIPGLGFEYGGAKRWLSLGPFSFQPAELLKFGVIVYLASWFSLTKKVRSIKFGVMPLIIVLGLSGLLLIAQPDTGTLLVLIITVCSMFFVAGARWKHIFLIGILVLATLSSIIATKPYILDRLQTFLDPTSDPTGSSWQIQQSLIAIGSGGITGRGFGQSVQKFDYLPEPIGDSIFAVAAEEFGLIGASFLIILFAIFFLRGIRISARSPDRFSGLLCLGIVILIVSQSFINIASMLGVLPLTGLPLLFVSHGGSALLVTLAEVGIVFNISKHL